jgi:hypothetical protein
MHTFDMRLLNLDGLIDKIDGTKLKICKPDVGGPVAPLLAAMQSGTPNAAPAENTPQPAPPDEPEAQDGNPTAQ